MQFKTITGILLLAISMLMASSMAAEEINEYTVNLSSSEDFGPYLVNETGFTLYYYLNDSGNGTSTCYDDCLVAWPAFYAENVTVPLALNASEFTEAVRDDEIKQTAYNGWPLYFYFEDTAPGDINGQAKNDVWFVVNPEEFKPIY